MLHSFIFGRAETCYGVLDSSHMVVVEFEEGHSVEFRETSSLHIGDLGTRRTLNCNTIVVSKTVSIQRG